MSTDTDSVVAVVPFRSRFGVRVLGWLLAALVGATSVIGAVSYVTARSMLERDVRLRLLGVAESKAEHLEAWADARREILTVIARMPRLVDALVAAETEANAGGLSGGGPVASLTTQLVDLGVAGVMVVGADGRILGATRATTGSALVGHQLGEASLRDTELARAVDRARTVGETDFTDFTGGAGEASPRALLAAPVFHRGRVVGVVVGEIDNAEVRRVVDDLTGLGDTGQVALSGFVGGHPTLVAPTRHEPDGAFRRLTDAELDQPIGLALRGHKGDGRSLGSTGERVFAVWRYVPALRWGIVTQMDESEAFAPAHELRSISLALTGAAALLATAIAVVIARRVSRPVDALTREARAIAGGDRSRVVPVEGRDEFAQLGRVFNQMLAELRKHAESLEDQVAERTRELATANGELVERGKRIRESVDLARQIEASMLPSLDRPPGDVRDVALIWRPLDGVGGDLVLLEPAADGGFVAGVIDCTGHGVPAAMTAMFASAMCSLAIATHGPEGPAAVLRELDRRLAAAFERARGEGIWLGLDIALVAWSPARKLRFVGAGIGLVYSDASGQLRDIAGRKRGLGYGARRQDAALVEHELDASDVSALFLFSDGILDEPAGPGGQSLGKRRLIELLGAAGEIELGPRLDALERAVALGRGDRSQRDDVTLLALQLKGRPALDAPEAG